MNSDSFTFVLNHNLINTGKFEEFQAWKHVLKILVTF